jgi:LemA protein
MIGWIVLGVVVLLLLYFIAIYNRLVRLRALVKEGFSGITVQLRRRADLIPNLVESVQGYASHEREVFEQVSKARAATMNAGSVEATAQADAQMTGLLGRLFAVAEPIPSSRRAPTSSSSRTSSRTSRPSFRGRAAITTRRSGI